MTVCRRSKEFQLKFLCAAAYILFLWIFRIPCPFYAIVGIHCPCCGMSRAINAVVHLQFHEAFRYHALFPLGIVILAGFVFEDLLPRKTSETILVFFAALLFVFWLFRLWSGDFPAEMFASGK